MKIKGSGADTEDRVSSSGYQLLYILYFLDRLLGNTTMNRNECTFLLTAHFPIY